MPASAPLDQKAVRRLLDQASSATLLADREGRIVYANRAAARLFGRPMEGLVASRLEDFFSADQRESFAAHWRRAREGTSFTGLATEVERPDGQVGAAEMSLIPTPSAGEGAVQINLQSLAVLRAAEAQSEETARLLAKQRRAQSAVESVLMALNKRHELSAMAACCLADVAKATGAQLGLIYACKPGEKQLQLLAHYLPGESQPDTEAIAGAPTLVARAIAEGKPLDASCLTPGARLSIKSGSWRRSPGGIAVHPLIFRDEVIGALLLAALRPFSLEDAQLIQLLAAQIAFVLAHARILTRSENMAMELSAKDEILEGHNDELLRRSEEILDQDMELIEKNEEIKKVDKLKRDFLEKMSREMRAPLGRIIQHLIFVLSNEEERLSAESGERLRGALGEGTAFSRTLNNIADLWRLREGQLAVDSKPVHIEAVVDEAIHHVQQVALEREVKIRKELDGVKGTFRADLGKLTQIMTEVIGNAVKFTSKGVVTVAAERTGDGLVCKVADTGIGIARDDLAYVFEEFFQVDESATSGFNGAGLGLCIAKHLTVLMGGSIALESEVGHGTTVTMEFPRTDSPGARAARQGNSQGNSQGNMGDV